MTGLASKIRRGRMGGAGGGVSWAGFDCYYFCCFPGEGFYFLRDFFFGSLFRPFSF